jgi:flagellar basal body-associated protein FliL
MVDTQTFSRSEIINLIIRLAVLTGVTFFSVKWMVSQLDPTNKQKKKAKKKVSYVLEMVRWFYIIYSST